MTIRVPRQGQFRRICLSIYGSCQWKLRRESGFGLRIHIPASTSRSPACRTVEPLGTRETPFAGSGSPAVPAAGGHPSGMVYPWMMRADGNLRKGDVAFCPIVIEGAADVGFLVDHPSLCAIGASKVPCREMERSTMQNTRLNRLYSIGAPLRTA